MRYPIVAEREIVTFHLRRADRVRKANRASQLKVGDSPRTRETLRMRMRLHRKQANGRVKRIWGSRLGSAPQGEERASSDNEEGWNVS